MSKVQVHGLFNRWQNEESSRGKWFLVMSLFHNSIRAARAQTQPQPLLTALLVYVHVESVEQLKSNLAYNLLVVVPCWPVTS